jgi:acyl dehydratase
MVAKALVDTLLDGDPAAVAGWSGRFAGSVYPGETLVASGWKRDGRYLVKVGLKERDISAFANGVMTVR